MSEAPARGKWAPPVFTVVAALVASLVIARWVRLSPDVSALLPDRGEAASLSRYLRSFGGGDPGLLLIEAGSAEAAEDAAKSASARLVGPAVAHVQSGEPPAPIALPPSAAMLLAPPSLAPTLEALFTEQGMRRRLAETRALLLAPGASSMAEALARDPLRVGQLVAEARQGASASKKLVSDDGKARLLLLEPSGNALVSSDARSFVSDVELRLDGLRREHTGVRFSLTGGHAIAAATEAMLRRDLTLSSALATLLSSLAFVLLFGRARALVAILPPLACGTAVAASAAALFSRGLSSISLAFASVVIGVGMDTGVHVYAAVQQALREGDADPVARAREHTTRPVLSAALVAGAAFASLALSRVEALRQLGVLSALGEIATALSIVAITPHLALALERRATPRPAPSWPSLVVKLARSRLAPLASIALLLPFAAALAAMGPPDTSTLVAVRPSTSEPHRVYERIAAALGDDHGDELVVLTRGASEEEARSRADRVDEALSSDPALQIAGVSAIAPSASTQAARRAERDRMLGRDARARLERALVAEGFSPARLEAALVDLERPASEVPRLDAATFALRRSIARDGGEVLVATMVRGASAEGLRARVAAIDATAEVTGLSLLEPSLRKTLASDLPLVSVVSTALVVLALAASLKKARDVGLALFVIAAELVVVLGAMRLLSVPLHIYDALVLPVLVGITIDEVLFVLAAARAARTSLDQAIADEAPRVATTAATTAAGFAALLVCDFDALRHLAVVGAAGSLAGLALALLVIPTVELRRARLFTPPP